MHRIWGSIVLTGRYSADQIRSVAWTFSGLALPLLVALAAIPLLLQRLGPERYGVLALAFSVTGAASLFDLGIGRASIQLIAGERARASAQAIARAAVRLTMISGGGAAVLYWVFILAGGLGWIKYSDQLAREVLIGALLLGLAIPLQASIATLRSLCEARGRFRAVAWVRMALGVGNFGAPLIAVSIVPHLVPAIGALVLVRIGAWIAYRTLAASALEFSNATDVNAEGDTNIGHRLIKAGGWLSVSAVVSPIMVQADKFFIASQLSVAEVSIYAIPAELVLQALICASAISTVAYPAFARQFHQSVGQGWRSYMRVLALTGLLMGLITTILGLLLPVGLPLWVGRSLPSEAIVVGQILCAGVFANSIGLIAITYLNAAGEFRKVALLHVMELPVFLFVLAFAVGHYGVEGAATAWVVRVAIDAVALIVLSFTIRTKGGR